VGPRAAGRSGGAGLAAAEPAASASAAAAAARFSSQSLARSRYLAFASVLILFAALQTLIIVVLPAEIPLHQCAPIPSRSGHAECPNDMPRRTLQWA
jgi:hypothetical protein